MASDHFSFILPRGCIDPSSGANSSSLDSDDLARVSRRYRSIVWEIVQDHGTPTVNQKL